MKPTNPRNPKNHKNLELFEKRIDVFDAWSASNLKRRARCTDFCLKHKTKKALEVKRHKRENDVSVDDDDRKCWHWTVKRHLVNLWLHYVTRVNTEQPGDPTTTSHSRTLYVGCCCSVAVLCRARSIPAASAAVAASKTSLPWRPFGATADDRISMKQ